IEAVSKSFVLGLADDVAIRLSDEDGRTRVDMRSASRYGRFDFDANAERVEAFLEDLRTRALIPAQAGDCGSRTREAARAEQNGKRGVTSANPRADACQPLMYRYTKSIHSTACVALSSASTESGEHAPPAADQRCRDPRRNVGEHGVELPQRSSRTHAGGDG